MDGEIIRRAILASYNQELRTVCASDRRRELIEARQAVAFAPATFFSELSDSTGLDLASIVSLFRETKVVRFFKAIGWSFKKLFGLLKTGVQAYRNILDAVADYVASTKVGRWTEKELKGLDEFLKTHPKTRRISGAVVAALLVYLWFLMAYTGDFEWDFDFSDILSALSGNYALSALFAGKEGTKLLLAVIAGTALRASFPWPGPTSIQFMGSVIYTLAKKFGKKLTRKKKSSAQELLLMAREILAEIP